MAQLAIKGHPTRGKEVIEILKMLGGKEEDVYSGTEEGWVYTIHRKGYIDWDYLSNKYAVYSLEEFLAKFPYKVGDRVYYDNKVCNVIEILWNSNLNTISYGVYDGKIKNLTIVEDLKPYKEKTMEDNIKEKCDLINFNSHHIFAFADRVELILKDDWEVKNEEGRTYVVRKKLNLNSRKMNKEQASEAYIKGKLRDSREYLGCEESRRMTLIQSDMYTVQEAFEDGWDAAMEELWKKAIPWLKANVHKRVINDTPKFGDFRALIGDRVWEDFKKAMTS